MQPGAGPQLPALHTSPVAQSASVRQGGTMHAPASQVSPVSQSSSALHCGGATHTPASHSAPLAQSTSPPHSLPLKPGVHSPSSQISPLAHAASASHSGGTMHTALSQTRPSGQSLSARQRVSGTHASSKQAKPSSHSVLSSQSPLGLPVLLPGVGSHNPRTQLVPDAQSSVRWQLSPSAALMLKIAPSAPASAQSSAHSVSVKRVMIGASSAQTCDQEPWAPPSRSAHRYSYASTVGRTRAAVEKLSEGA